MMAAKSRAAFSCVNQSCRWSSLHVRIVWRGGVAWTRLPVSRPRWLLVVHTGGCARRTAQPAARLASPHKDRVWVGGGALVLL